MTIAVCTDCGAGFDRDPDEAWKSRCIGCWSRRKYGDAYRPPRRPAATLHVDPIRRELAGQLRALLSLCHPDKHSNSPLATTTTQWLLALRDRLEHAPRENVR